MNQSTNLSRNNNLVRAAVTIRGTRPLLQHAFGPDAIPLEQGERHGVPGNDPTEWTRTKQVTSDGVLYLTSENVFSCLRDGARFVKKGRGSIQSLVAATLQVETEIIRLNRRVPEKGEPPRDKTAPVYVDISSVKNPTTKGRNVRYRLATGAGWECSFVLLWDKTIVSRDLMRAVIRDAGILVGIGDGRTIGKGRFDVISIVELDDAAQATAEGSLEQAERDSVVKGRKAVRAMSGAGATDGVPH